MKTRPSAGLCFIPFMECSVRRFWTQCTLSTLARRSKALQPKSIKAKALEPMCGCTDPFKVSHETNSDALDHDLGKDKHHASTTAPSSSLQNRDSWYQEEWRCWTLNLHWLLDHLKSLKSKRVPCTTLFCWWTPNRTVLSLLSFSAVVYLDGISASRKKSNIRWLPLWIWRLIPTLVESLRPRLSIANPSCLVSSSLQPPSLTPPCLYATVCNPLTTCERGTVWQQR